MSAEKKRHKWVEDVNGKQCTICGSRVNNKNGFYRFQESDRFGVIDGVNWYPRCLFDQQLEYETQKITKWKTS